MSRRDDSQSLSESGYTVTVSEARWACLIGSIATKCQANVTVLSRRVGEIENVRELFWPAGELTAQQKQSGRPKLHTYLGRVSDISSKLKPLHFS
jgi:hypothetical protein